MFEFLEMFAHLVKNEAEVLASITNRSTADVLRIRSHQLRHVGLSLAPEDSPSLMGAGKE